MKLQTTVPIKKADNPISYKTKIVLLGSCFVEHIGEKLEYFRFQTTQNPFGILFHPLAIENLVENAINGKNYDEDAVFENAGIWHCFDAHSDLNALSETELLDNLNNALKVTSKGLKEATHVIITLGTAWAYHHISTQKTVANCHKVPQREFSKTLLSIDEIKFSLERTVEQIALANPEVQIIFTVSPVRHLKDGFVENQRSKAHLISAIHDVVSLQRAVTLSLSKGQPRSLSYFPSYEIMMDELRDYRFYGKDLVHPNALAVDYIWERFASTWIASESQTIMEEVDHLQKALRHRPFNPESEAHQKFKKSLQVKMDQFQTKYPFISFT